MGRRRSGANVSRVEMLRARVTYTETGYPANLRDVEGAYGPRVCPTPIEGWFWVGASLRAAQDIRRRGLRAVGDLTTTWIPPQSGIETFDVLEDDVPLAGSAEHVRAMLAETGEGLGYFEAEAPEKPPGPLRKVIVFRLRRAS